ncbi:MAG TPA: hypothetical protein VK918_04005 [Pyrinomonadaceae bacterium]|nr:hypothetical protein [Pyrinomonadaceae bacterium]
MAEINKTTYPLNADRRKNAGTFPSFDTPQFSFSRNQSPLDRPNIDEVIVSLSDSYENQRARQVVEWVRQQSVRRSV